MSIKAIYKCLNDKLYMLNRNLRDTVFVVGRVDYNLMDRRKWEFVIDDTYRPIFIPRFSADPIDFRLPFFITYTKRTKVFFLFYVNIGPLGALWGQNYPIFKRRNMGELKFRH